MSPVAYPYDDEDPMSEIPREALEAHSVSVTDPRDLPGAPAAGGTPGAPEGSLGPGPPQKDQAKEKLGTQTVAEPQGLQAPTAPRRRREEQVQDHMSRWTRY
jgi:hypothetical protein